ncbi:MAG: histidinol-phosphatase HisJ family protein [Candidatus Ornithomonoglobus sp.]
MDLYDGHMHTVNSLDGGQTVEEICQTAAARGLSGVSITDHVDMWFYKRENTEERIRTCIEQVNSARERYIGRLKLLQGVEMAEYLYSPEEAEIIMKLTDYDVILGSVHSVLYEDWTDSYSRLPFGEMDAPKEKLIGFMREYFARVAEMAEKTDFDVLSHLTCPLRYINGKFSRGIDIDYFKNEINGILELIIKRNIALEVNTSGINTSFASFMPGADIIKSYYDMGGRLITIGSDAHVSSNIGSGLEEAAELLKSIGFRSYNYYEKRMPKEVLFEGGGDTNA